MHIFFLWSLYNLWLSFCSNGLSAKMCLLPELITNEYALCFISYSAHDALIFFTKPKRFHLLNKKIIIFTTINVYKYRDTKKRKRWKLSITESETKKKTNKNNNSFTNHQPIHLNTFCFLFWIVNSTGCVSWQLTENFTQNK